MIGRANLRYLEVGVFEKWLNLPPANGESYLLGSFGTITLDLVTGDGSGREHGLEKGESAIHQVWKGEILGDNYPSAEKPVSIRVESLIVKQGKVFNQVRATVHIGQQSRRPSDYNTVQLFAFPSTDIGVFGSTRFDGQDAYDKTSAGPLVRDLDRYWQVAKKNRDLLHPDSLKNRETVRRAMRGD